MKLTLPLPHATRRAPRAEILHLEGQCCLEIVLTCRDFSHWSVTHTENSKVEDSGFTADYRVLTSALFDHEYALTLESTSLVKSKKRALAFSSESRFDAPSDK